MQGFPSEARSAEYKRVLFTISRTWHLTSSHSFSLEPETLSHCIPLYTNGLDDVQDRLQRRLSFLGPVVYLLGNETVTRDDNLIQISNCQR